MSCLAFCLRRQHNSSYKQWEVINIIQEEPLKNCSEFLIFKLTDEQAGIALEKMRTHRLYIKYQDLSETELDGWVTEERNSEIKDISEIPNWWDFVEDSEEKQEGQGDDN